MNTKKINFKKIFKACPFVDDNGQIHIHRRPLRDIAYIWGVPAPTHHGKGIIEIPEFVRDEYKEGIGLLLAIGPGWHGKDPKRKNPYGRWIPESKKSRWHPTPKQLTPGSIVVFDKFVPWTENIMGLDGKEHWLTMCSSVDIKGVWNV
jgi:hypothetical protein